MRRVDTLYSRAVHFFAALFAAAAPLFSRIARAAPCRCSKRAAALTFLALAAACFTPLFIVRAFPGSTAYHHLRIAAGYLGFGWCHPVFPPKTVHTFPPAPPWVNDGAFWENFPCARSEYRVWLPEGTPPAAAATCDNVIVSAYFDIGRAQWPFLARPPDFYEKRVKTVLTLRNPLVFFTTPAFGERVVAARRALGLMDRTLVVGHDLHCASQAWLLADATAAMCAPEATARLWAFSKFLAVPERQEPWYNLVMWMKAGLLRAAAALPQPALGGRSVTWLDAGCHTPMCAPALAGACLNPAPWTRPGRIRIAQVGTQTDALAALGPSAWTRAHHVLFAGTVFSAPRASAGALMDEFLDTLQWLLTRGVADTDQTVFAWLWARKPELFDAFPTSGSWHNVVRNWAGATQRPYAGEFPWFPVDARGENVTFVRDIYVRDRAGGGELKDPWTLEEGAEEQEREEGGASAQLHEVGALYPPRQPRQA